MKFWTVKLIKIFYISLLLICSIWVFYKFSKHTEVSYVGRDRYESSWHLGKVYQLIIYENDGIKPTKLFRYSRENVRFLATPQLRWHPHPTVADYFFIDTNDDGIWDVKGKWNYPDGGYIVQQDTDYNGKYDKTTFIDGIM